MRLYVMYSDSLDFFVSGGYVIVSYPMNISINKLLEKSRNYLIESVKEEYERCDSFYKLLLEKFIKLLNKNDNTVINCFEAIEFDYPKEDVYYKLDTLFDKTDTSVIIKAQDIDDTYLLENISILDNKLKEIGVNRVSYIIKQCVDARKAHGVDISYSLEDVLLVLNYINDIASNIRKFKLTPLEQVMYIYDLVKDRYYKEESEYEDYLESRDIARILKGNRIVCLGFSYLFKSLLDSINIPNEISFIKGVNSNIGHARVFVGIEDNKYNLNQVLYFDPTWDSKKEKDNTNLLDRYNHFARNKKYFTMKDKTKGLVDEEYLPFDVNRKNFNINVFSNKDCLRQVSILFRMINWREYFNSTEISEFYRNEIDVFMNTNIIDFYEIKDYNFVSFMYQECSKMLDRGLSGDVFLECLTNVRRVENALDCDKFVFDFDRMNKIYEEYLSDEIKFNKDLELHNDEVDDNFDMMEALKLLKKTINNDNY